MINYYYEIHDDVTVFGRKVKYLALFNHHPASPEFPHTIHSEVVQNSRRVWLENANGISLVKAPNYISGWGPMTGEQELTWLKLQCLDIESIT